MARTTSTNYSAPSFPKANAAADPFLKEDIQQLAEALDTHDHTTGKGLAVSGGGGGVPPANSVTSAMIVDGTIQTGDIGDSQITSVKIADGTIVAGDMAAGAAAGNVGVLGGALSGTLPNPTLANNSVGASQISDGSVGSAELAAGAAATNVGTLGGVLSGTLPNPGLANNSVGSAQIVDGSVAAGDLAAGAAAANVGTLGGVLGGTLPNPTMAAGAAATNVGALGGSLSGTLPNPTLAANSVGASQITDGTVGTAELANGAVTNAKLASDTARANLLTNGGFEIWQRGNGPFSGSLNTRTADQWMFSGGAGDTFSVSRDIANMDTGSTACAAITFTKASGATFFIQQLTYADNPSLSGRTVSFSIRVRTATANAVRAAFYNGSTWTYSAYHTGGGTYQTLTVPNVALTGTSMYGVALDVSCTTYLDNAMLVVGSVPADYAPLHPADDLARCLRYYERLGGTVLEFLGTGQATNTTQVGAIPIRWKVQKAVVPTVTFDAAAQYAVLNAAGTQLSLTVITSASTTPDGTTVVATVASGLVAGNASVLAGSGTGRVYSEANP